LSQSGRPSRENTAAFAPGDKVMQIADDYDKEVYNGDIGYVGNVDPGSPNVDEPGLWRRFIGLCRLVRFATR